LSTDRLDTLVHAETPEGIALALHPAGVAPRFWAFVIDLLIRAALMIVVAIALAALGGVGRALTLVAYFLIEWLYPVFFELRKSGATPGKRSQGLRVVMDSGLPVTPGASLLRNLLRAADFLPFGYAFGFLSMLTRADFKRLGDIAAGTLVVYARSASLDGPLPEASPIPPARPLSSREQAAVVAWAGRAGRLTPERLGELALLATPVSGTNGRSSKESTSRLLGVAQWLLGHR
jgi:uncharacterized RDD family membrane protein YckC